MQSNLEILQQKPFMADLQNFINTETNDSRIRELAFDLQQRLENHCAGLDHVEESENYWENLYQQEFETLKSSLINDIRTQSRQNFHILTQIKIKAEVQISQARLPKGSGAEILGARVDIVRDWHTLEKEVAKASEMKGLILTSFDRTKQSISSEIQGIVNRIKDQKRSFLEKQAASNIPEVPIPAINNSSQSAEQSVDHTEPRSPGSHSPSK